MRPVEKLGQTLWDKLCGTNSDGGAEFKRNIPSLLAQVSTKEELGSAGRWAMAQAGPFPAARLAAAGKKVAILERGLFGGACVNTGCIPTEAMSGANDDRVEAGQEAHPHHY